MQKNQTVFNNTKIYHKKLIIQIAIILKKDIVSTGEIIMFFKNYAEFTEKVPHDSDFIKKRLKKRCLSWKSWRNYFFTPDRKIDFRFSQNGKYILLYPIFRGRNSMRGQFFLDFEPLSDGSTLVHVAVKAPASVYFFMFVWFSGVILFTIYGLLSGIWHLAAVGAIMMICGFFMLFFMRKSAENELDDTINAFKNLISDDYIRD